ncbi:hypothetical protein NP493_232g03009 [Ridgeia piscesae]|uniref:SAM domain-containing protein n=1 Tax=Ridgeia piscesae TaxID=27915 RepID=A0AAD9NZT2_RIDPI|nr:hypothetical protein NP493_232g03009 [Ridgeia piscesae]
MSRETTTVSHSVTSESTLTDLKDDRIPTCLMWTVQQVADWMEEIGFPDYKPCIITNLVDGKKLIRINGSTLPHLGITDFEHIKKINKALAVLLSQEPTTWDRRIALPPRDALGMYLLEKSVTGDHGDNLTFEKFLRTFDEIKWQPPLSNQCALLPRDTTVRLP